MAVFIDGADFESYVSAPAGPCFDANICCPFTIEAWFKPYDSQGERMIINKEDTWETASQAGTFMAAVAFANDEGRNAGWTWHDSELSIGVNVWNHGAVVWDPPDVRMYLNGKEGKFGEHAGKQLAWNHEDTFKMGRRERGGATHSIYHGLIDEARISKGARYNGDYDVPETEFVPDADTRALYHLNEVEGAATIVNAAKEGGHAKPCPDAVLEGAVELWDAGPGSGHEQPFEPFAVQPGDKMTTTWGHVKDRPVH
jgi:hypothetical protein